MWLQGLRMIPISETVFSFIESGNLEPCICYSSAFGQTATNDAQKRQKNAVSRRTTRDFRKKQRKHLAEYIMAELLPFIPIPFWY